MGLLHSNIQIHVAVGHVSDKYRNGSGTWTDLCHSTDASYSTEVNLASGFEPVHKEIKCLDPQYYRTINLPVFVASNSAIRRAEASKVAVKVDRLLV